MRLTTRKINQNKLGIIIYARMSSKRFSGKVLKKIFNDQNVLQLIVNKLKKDKLHSKIIVATSKLKIDKKIVNFCKSNKINFFLGSHKDVFLRTKQCIKKYKLKYFVRICGDRPFFDTFLMKKMINIILRKDFDIVTNVNPRTYPKGLTCEISKAKIFEKVDSNTLSKNEKEHIFNYFYKKKKYKIYNLKSKFSKKFISKNFSLNTKKDIYKIRKIHQNFSTIKNEINTINLYKIFKKRIFKL